MRLIDADWVLEHIKPYERSDERWSVTGGTAIRLIHNAIDNAPTAHAVKVTRCKDCKHAYINSFAEASGTALCAFWTNRAKGEAVVMQADDFCSYGKPKEENKCD